MVEPAQAVGAACRQETCSMAQVSLCVGSLVSRATPRFTHYAVSCRNAAFTHDVGSRHNAAFTYDAGSRGYAAFTHDAGSRRNAAFTYDAGSRCNVAYHKYCRFMPQCCVHERRRFTPQYRKSRPPLIHAAMPHSRAMLFHAAMPHIARTGGSRRNSAFTSDAVSRGNATYRAHHCFPPQCLTSRTPPDCALALERNPDRTWVRHMIRLKPVA